MKNKAFTLIELLVVVLIIGILAAIAVPQYQKAVRRSKVAQVVNLVRAIGNAQIAFELANGRYATTPEELDINYTCPEGWNCVFETKQNEIYDPTPGNRIGIIYRHAPDKNYPEFEKKLYCWADKSDSKNVAVCASFGPLLSDMGNYARYLIQ